MDYTFNGRPVIVDLPTDETTLKPVKLCFHGASGNAATFKAQLALEPQDAYVVYLTASGTPTAWRVDANAEAEVAYINWVLEELKILHPNMDIDDITDIGHSNGGSMACTYAHYEPEIVQKVILINSYAVQTVTDFTGEVRHIHAIDDTIIPFDGGTYPSVADTKAVFKTAGADYLLTEIKGDHSMASVKAELLSNWGLTLSNIVGA